MANSQEKLVMTNITDIMQTAYIDYSMSVIVSRALPDVRDGLKPVQRRIIYAMFREGLRHNTAFDKCAGVVGEVLKNYHPHGDASVYDTLVRMAQDWVMRYPLIVPQGNFGSIEGDSAAAYRYTECKLNELSEDLLKDIDEDTVDLMQNYKESTKEPTVLPCALPHLLMNGSTGIAVGMATNIPPHNVTELVEACCQVADNPNISFDEIEKIIKGPDFPTGGIINGTEGISQYLRTGRGIIRVRGVLHVEEQKNGKIQIVITEIPYNVNRALLVTKIADLVREKVFTEISDIRNESDENTRIVIDLKRDASERVVINKLYKHTELESSFGVILLALDGKRPKQMNIKEMLECFIEHRREVITRRTKFRLRKAEDRAHILEGFKIAYRYCDDFVKIIRASKDRDDARTKLMDKYGLTERQCNAVLDMRLYKLTGLEIDKIEAEYVELIGFIEECRDILSNEKRLLKLVKGEMRDAAKKYDSPRKTRIQAAEGEFSLQDLIPNEGCMISVSHQGFVKRTSLDLYRTQRRGGKGLIGADAHSEDFIEDIFSAKTHDTVMFFTNKGRVYVKKAYEIPEGARTSKGRSIVNVIEMQEGEELATMLCIPEFTDTKNVFFCTKNGVVKKTVLSAYQNCNRRGIIAINLREGDELISVKLTNGNDQVMLISESGMTIRFDESDVRNLGRSTAGVTGMRLREGDKVVALAIVDPKCTLLIAGKNGIGKRTQYDDEEGEVFRKQKRGGVGVIGIKNKFGVAGAMSVLEDDQVMLLTKGGQAIRMPVKGIRRTGRAAQGVKLMDIDAKSGEEIIGICKIVVGDDEVASPTKSDSSEPPAEQSASK